MFGRFRHELSVIRGKLGHTYASKAYGTFSQYGEDLIIHRLLGNKSSGVYVDVGANDPTKFNNTTRFYRIGWTGINIEPNPQLMDRFVSVRPKDINLNIGVGRERSTLPFYSINPDTLSTFDRGAADEAKRQGYKIEKTVDVEVHLLAEILDKHLAGRPIDFISVDVEGFELDVLESNDWNRFRPTIVMIEVNRAVAEIQHFMAGHHYIDAFSNGTNTEPVAQ